jgi:hypothetical protein
MYAGGAGTGGGADSAGADDEGEGAPACLPLLPDPLFLSCFGPSPESGSSGSEPLGCGKRGLSPFAAFGLESARASRSTGGAGASVGTASPTSGSGGGGSGSASSAGSGATTATATATATPSLATFPHLMRRPRMPR